MFFFKIFLLFFFKPLKNFSVKFFACFYAAAAFFWGWRLFPDLACISIVSTIRRSQLAFHWQFLFGDMKTANRARWRWRPPICERVNELVNLRGLRQTKWRLSGTDGDVLHLRLASCGHLTESQGVTAKARGGGGGSVFTGIFPSLCKSAQQLRVKTLRSQSHRRAHKGKQMRPAARAVDVYSAPILSMATQDSILETKRRNIIPSRLTRSKINTLGSEYTRHRKNPASVRELADEWRASRESALCPRAVTHRERIFLHFLPIRPKTLTQI